MVDHLASIRWKREAGEQGDFCKGQYSRVHTWSFDGGVTVAASPSPAVVPVPYSNPDHVDPEEAFVASVASCHMLTFLHLASKEGFELESYTDDAVGKLTKNEKGVPWVSSITLDPQIGYVGEKVPSAEDEERLHHLAHDHCFIAASIKTAVTVKAP